MALLMEEHILLGPTQEEMDALFKDIDPLIQDLVFIAAIMFASKKLNGSSPVL